MRGVRRPGVLSRKSRNATYYRPAGHKPVMSRSSRSRAGHEPVQSVMWTGVLGGGERTSGPIGQNDRRSGSLHPALAAAHPQLASSSSSTHGSETLGVLLRVSLARVLHVCVERGRGALRARGYRSTLGKQTLYGALESAYRASGGERRRPRRHLSKRARVIIGV